MKECPNCGTPRPAGSSECDRCGTDFEYLDEKLAKTEAEAARIRERRDRIIRRIDGLMANMDEKRLVALLAYVNEIHEKKDRIHPRIPCLIPADYVTRDRARQDYIKDISLGGLFLETGESFSEGEEITLTLSFSQHVKPFKVAGKVVRSSPNGIGIKFQTASQIQSDLIKGLVKKVEAFNKAR